MMTKMTLLTMSSLSMSLTMNLVPLTLGMTIFIMALTTLIFTSIMANNWLALALFLIYIGGMLVLFTYFLAILPNQFLNFIFPTVFFLSTLATIGLNEHTLLCPPQWSLSSFFIQLVLSNQNITIILTLALALLLILIITVKLTLIKSGPLRPHSFQHPN